MFAGVLGDRTPLTAGRENESDKQTYGSIASARRKKKVKNAHAMGLPPKSLTSKSVDGVVSHVQVTPKSIFGMAEPPGGWYGPFGFLRLVSYSFMFMSAIMLMTFVYGLAAQENIWSLSFCLILCVASLLAAGAAYSHEGLANQVSKMARHNSEYAALNDDFTRQTNDLEGVADRIDELLKGKAETIEEFKSHMSKLDQLSSLNLISTVVRSFIDAQMQEYAKSGGQGDPDGLLTHSEVRDFLNGAKTTLKDRVPEFDSMKLARSAFFPGVSLSEINLLVATIDTDFEEEKQCFMQLMFFFLNPHGVDLNELKDCVASHLSAHEVYGQGDAVEREIDRLASLAPKEKRQVMYAGEQRETHYRVPVKETKPLLGAVLHTFMTDNAEDLGVSDDEEA